MDQKATVRLTIDNKEITVAQNMTILEAARENGIRIPTLCHHPALSNWGGCRICVVEVDKAPRLVASCVMPVREGMEVVTSNERILESRRTILEFLFAERNHYCMFCAQSGDCELQSLAYELGMDHLTVPPSFKEFPIDATNPYMALDHNRCILCGRCVRACKELAGNSVLNYQNRGARTLICKDLNDLTEDSSCDSSGVCLQVCPTGAMYQRLRPHQAVLGKRGPVRVVQTRCAVCGLLCQGQYSVRDGNLMRIDGLLSTQRPDRGQLCRKGRFEPLVNKGGRILEPMVRGKDHELHPTTWEDALERLAAGMMQGRQRKAGLLGLVSADCSCEEIWLFKEMLEEGMGGHAGLLEREALLPIQGALKEMERTFLGLRECSWVHLSEADFILLVGGHPEESHPLLVSMIRRASMERGAWVASMGGSGVSSAFRTLHAEIASHELAEAVRFLLARALEGSGSFNPITRWRRILSEVEPIRSKDSLKELPLQLREVVEQIASGFMNSLHPLIVAGPELSGKGEYSALQHVMFLALLKGLLPQNGLRLILLKPGGNPACALRLNCLGIPEESEARGAGACLLLLGGGQNHGLGGVVPRADFLGVIGSHVPEELLNKAHVILPRPLWLEQEGSYLSLDGHEMGHVSEVLSPPPGVRRSWETLLALAGRTGVRALPSTMESLRARTMAAMNLS
ncbi:MAG: 2Fe-2S iron-sulfur cluster-binding protein [bacterium]